ncbi:DUF1652 domain-containing protein [Pseudomonas sp. R5(2019)]|uniref:DUF1652 domain-containing protein n=1 Tax=Pseudomonas sp. R5(2019) TaxID=2697566 RepID=UPI00141285FE|nr:DUF1652 domain-containing protein [Pseudomonas sp. R5(2019)]NBA97678.1 DUF1652 domain-containing protein [Pseudomonas sp. R5(2019)]
MMCLGLSSLELRNIIECGFLPRHCTCEVAPDETLTVVISDPVTNHVQLRVEGISTDRLASSRDISDLIAELRVRLEHPQRAPLRAVTH